MEKLIPNTPEARKLLPREAIGKIIGNFEILERVGDGKVRSRCLLCGNDKHVTKFGKITSGHTTSCGCKHKLINPEQYIGITYNKLTLTGIHTEKDVDGAVLGVFKCECGKENIIKRLNNVQREKFKSCGDCVRNKYINRGEINKYDIDEFKRIIDIWRQMMLRCYCTGKHVTNDPELLFLNKNVMHPRFKDYGARDIDVCKEWHDRNTFYKWYSTNIKTRESMDRIDNDKGYSPQNCRSLSVSLQNMNQRLKKSNTSGYKGIYHTGYSYGWRLVNNKKVISKEGYVTKEQALLDRNLTITINKLPNAIQYLNNTRIFFVSSENKYTLMCEKDHILSLGSVLFNRKDDPVLIETIQKMNKIIPTAIAV